MLKKSHIPRPVRNTYILRKCTYKRYLHEQKFRRVSYANKSIHIKRSTLRVKTYNNFAFYTWLGTWYRSLGHLGLPWNRVNVVASRIGLLSKYDPVYGVWWRPRSRLRPVRNRDAAPPGACDSAGAGHEESYEFERKPNSVSRTEANGNRSGVGRVTFFKTVVVVKSYVRGVK